MKIKKRHWDGASLVLDVAVQILQERPAFGDLDYQCLLTEAIEATEKAAEYAFKKSLGKKEREELYGE